MQNVVISLTTEFHPVPKVYKSKKMPKAINKAGKKTKEWTDIREVLKKEFAEKGITRCELKYKKCWDNTALTFAHIDKRRKLTKEDLWKVVLACTPCHIEVEAMKAEEMRKTLEGIIKNRNI